MFGVLAFCMVLQDRCGSIAIGNIFSVDHHQDPDPDDENPEYINLHFMCDNFEDFINRLKESP